MTANNPHPLAVGYRAAVGIRNVFWLVVKLGWAWFCLRLAWWPFKIALLLFSPHSSLTSMWNLAAGACVLAAVVLGYHALNIVLEALPSITPRWISNAPGQSRLATRDELRRGRVIW
jgi:hypothetical protein